MTEAPSSSPEELITKGTEALSKTQRQVLESVLKILEENPKLNKTLQTLFQGNILSIVSNPEKLDQLLILIKEKTEYNLENIWSQFKNGLLPKTDAISQSKIAIENGSTVGRLALRGNISTATQSA